MIYSIRRAIQEETTSLIEAMFAARGKNREAEIIIQNLIIDNQAYDISSVASEYRPVC